MVNTWKNFLIRISFSFIYDEIVNKISILCFFILPKINNKKQNTY